MPGSHEEFSSDSSMVDINVHPTMKPIKLIASSDSSMVDINQRGVGGSQYKTGVQIPLWSILTHSPVPQGRGLTVQILYGRY